jgi:transcriptional regulator with XRE-family HTH domain
MTPFGARLRALRAERGLTLHAMADALGVSPAYLSALEHGRRGRPTHALVVAICAQLNIIWDDADELIRLARLSHPRITVDTAGLSPKATELANLLAERIRKLPEATVDGMLELLRSMPATPPPPRRRRARPARATAAAAAGADSTPPAAPPAAGSLGAP